MRQLHPPHARQSSLGVLPLLGSQLFHLFADLSSALPDVEISCGVSFLCLLDRRQFLQQRHHAIRLFHRVFRHKRHTPLVEFRPDELREGRLSTLR
jgi:hypothetical protein